MVIKGLLLLSILIDNFYFLIMKNMFYLSPTKPDLSHVNLLLSPCKPPRQLKIATKEENV